MTKKEALEAAAKQWRWMAKKTRKEKRTVVQIEYYQENPETQYDTTCFLCGYAKKEARKNNDECKYINSKCAYCPSETWANRTDNHFRIQPCCMEGSLYRAWEFADMDDWEKKADAADKVAEMMDQELCNLEEKEE